MMDTNVMVAILKAINELNEDSFGAGTVFIVDGTHNLPAGREIRYGLCLTDITGFSASNLKLETGSGDYPSALVAGIELPRYARDITVTSGSIYCILE